MYPTISFYLAQARSADLRHDAQRAALARAARRAAADKPTIRHLSLAFSNARLPCRPARTIGAMRAERHTAA